MTKTIESTKKSAKTFAANIKTMDEYSRTLEARITKTNSK